MGILNAIENAAEAVVEGAKDLVGLGDEKQEETVEAVGADLTEAAVVEPVEEVQADVAPVDPPRVYTVQAGDTLSKISKEYYGNSSDYMKIFEANRNILDEPDEIKVGQGLVIPD